MTLRVFSSLYCIQVTEKMEEKTLHYTHSNIYITEDM